MLILCIVKLPKCSYFDKNYAVDIDISENNRDRNLKIRVQEFVEIFNLTKIMPTSDYS